MNMASNMVSQVKSTTPMPSDSLVQGFDLRFFYGAKFSGLLGPNGIKSSIFNDHVLGVTSVKALVRVSRIAPITKANVSLQEPRGVNERLDP